jgi:hypothetical protein
MDRAGSLEILVHVFQTTRRHIQADCLNNHRRENLNYNTAQKKLTTFFWNTA